MNKWTQAASERWEGRAREQGEIYLRTYWEDVAAPHRVPLVEAVYGLEPRSVLEVGCHAGPNLRMLSRPLALRHTVLSGIDISPEAIDFARAQFALEGIGVDLRCQSILTMDMPRAEVVFTCYTLAYISPDDIGLALDRLWTHTTRALVLAEPMLIKGPETSIPLASDRGLIRLSPCPEWAHDYPTMAWRLPGFWKLTLEPAVCLAGHLNAVLTIHRRP